MRTVIHEISKTARRISLIYPAKQNDLVKAQGHFTPTQKEMAKIRYELSFNNRSRNLHHEGRMELIEALAQTKRTPRMNLVVNIL